MDERLMRWPLKKDPTEADRAFPGYANAGADVQLVAEGLWRATDEHGRRELVVPELAAELLSAGWLWATGWADAIDRVEMAVLALEESGFLSTYIAEGSQWLSLHRPLRALASPNRGFSPPARSRVIPGDDSTTMGGARARAWERAGARVGARVSVSEREWEREREREQQVPSRPEPPPSLGAPPLGCPDHPRGLFLDCGPCGTARRQWDLWMDRHRYENKLADWEFWYGTDQGAAGDDEPF